MDASIINEILDVQGLMSPMPLVKARITLMQMDVGQVLKVLATDRGSLQQFQGWARTARNIELLAQSEEQVGEETVLVHLVKRTR
jgi:TusA-related sulfurtransferase